jgi:pimeloyl-ACP methyl ester carboxylesterase
MLTVADRGAGSCVLLLHGFALDGRAWQPQQESLSERHRTLAVDLPGFGRTPARLPAGTSATRAILDTLDALEIDRVHVVGHSLGGALAVDFALAFPHRTRTLVLVSAVVRGRPTGIAAWPRCVELARAGKLDEARACWLADPLFERSREHAPTLATLRALAADYDGGHWRGESSTVYESAEPPGARLAELRAPTLVVVGDRDLPAFRELADEYASTLPRATKRVLAGVGHVPNLEAPAAFDAALREFLDS